MVETIPFKGQILSDAPLALGEGPTYDPATDTAWWFNITGRELIECRMASGDVTVHDLPEMASVLAVVDGDTQVIATETGLYKRDVKTGVLTRYVEIEAGNPANRSNDGRVHQCGALWFGTMGKVTKEGAGTIYHVLKGEVRPIFEQISIPNAICFSPDGATAYFTDTRVNDLMCVAIDPKTALPIGEPDVLFSHRGEGGLDGAVVDAEGCLWNARWGVGCVDVYSPSGERIKSLEVPARQSSCPAFVGRNADRLLVTSAAAGLDGAQREADPMAGYTFLLDTPVKGRLEPKMVL